MASASLTFEASHDFSLGVEEELLMASPGSFRPCGGTDAVLARLDPRAGTFKGEASDGVLELVTPIRSRVADAIGALRAMRAEASRHVRLLGVGLHPLARFGDVRLRGGARYDLIGASMRALMRQTPHCGVHVHVGMPDGESAVRACNGLRAWIPLLQALGANSPYWYGQDSGLASARSVICNSFPRAGIPRPFTGYEDYARTVAELQALGECPDFSFLWWDVRPHPRLGTVEIRALDAQASLDDLAGLVALIHCLAVHAATAPRTPAGRTVSPEALRELSFRACRDGLDARLMLDDTLRPARELAVRAIALAGTYAADLGCWDELMQLHHLLEDGTGAQRQRRAEREGGMRLLLHRIADQTAHPKDAQPPSDAHAPRMAAAA
jgi:carboxylate-amine ligase